MKSLVTLLVVALFVLHQDFWYWDAIEPLAFGCLPPGIWYHGLLSIAAAVVWWLATTYCWPKDVDVAEQQWAAGGKDVDL